MSILWQIISCILDLHYQYKLFCGIWCDSFAGNTFMNQGFDFLSNIESRLLKKMCSYGNAEALQKAQEILLSYRQTGGKIAPNLRDIVYVYGMQGFDTWKWMLDLYKVENNAQEKLKLLRGLCSSGQPWILSHLLDLAWDEAIVRRQDYFTLITYMSWNRIGMFQVHHPFLCQNIYDLIRFRRTYSLGLCA